MTTSEVTRTLNPLEFVSSLTIIVTAELKVQCLTVINERIIMDSGFIYIAGNVRIEVKGETRTNVLRSITFLKIIVVPPSPIELRAPDVSDVVFGRTTIMSNYYILDTIGTGGFGL